MRLIGFLLVTLAIFAFNSMAQNEDTLPVGAVPERAVSASSSVDAFRPVGDYRLWRFFSRGTTFGRLSSLVRDTVFIDGESALAIHESLTLDYTKLGAEQQTDISGETYVTGDGRFLGHGLEIGGGPAPDRFELVRDGSSLEGYFTRGGQEQSLSTPYDTSLFFWDMYFVDQLEIYLAMQELEIGTRLDDSIYLPQSMMKARLSGLVTYFMWQEIYKGRIDSVYIIRLQEPSPSQLYFTPDKKLVRVDLLNQGIRVYQDLVRDMSPVVEKVRPQQEASGLSLRLLLLRLPHYAAFLVLAAIALAFVTTRAFRWKQSYLFLLAGVVAFLPMPLFVNRLLMGVARGWFEGGNLTTGSIYLLGAVPPLLLALIQTGLLLGFFVASNRWLQAREYRWVGLGAFVGAGFALAEAMYSAGLRVTPLFDWALAERAAGIFLYTMSGALVARSWLEARKGRGLLWLLIVIVFIGVLRYLPLMVQTETVDVQAMHFVMIVVVLIYLVVSLSLLKRPIVESSEDEVSEPDPAEDNSQG